MPIKSRNVFKGDEKIYNFGNVSAPLIIGFFYVLDGKLLYYVLNPELRREKKPNWERETDSRCLLWCGDSAHKSVLAEQAAWGNSIG